MKLKKPLKPTKPSKYLPPEKENLGVYAAFDKDSKSLLDFYEESMCSDFKYFLSHLKLYGRYDGDVDVFLQGDHKEKDF